MDDSIVVLNDKGVNAGPSSSHQESFDENDDFIVPLPTEDAHVEYEPISQQSSPLKKGTTRTRARKRCRNDDDAPTAAEETNAELKALKLAEKQEKKEAVERRKAERLEKRLAKESERLLKKQQREATRARQPKSLIKNIMIHVDNRIKELDKKGEFEKRARENLLDSNEPMSLDFEDSTVPYSISWTIPDINDIKTSSTIPADEIVIVLPVTEIINLIHGSMTGDAHSNLRRYFEDVKRAAARKTVSLIIFGLDGYLLNYKTLKNRDHRQRCTGEKSSADLTKGLKAFDGLKAIVSPEDIERALVELQIITGIPHTTAADEKELAVLVQHLTKAIAEKPEKMRKRAAQASLTWHDSGLAKSMKPLDDGENRELWKRIILQSCSRQDPPFAEAVVSKYGNPRQLMETYRECVNEERAANLLSGIDERGRRRYEASRRVHMMFTCRDPEAVLDKEK